MNGKTKRISVTAIGVALFVALALCLQVPVFENYYLCLGYVVMAIYCYFFGPISGMIVGGLGVVFYCLLTNGLKGKPAGLGAWKSCDRLDRRANLQGDEKHRQSSAPADFDSNCCNSFNGNRNVGNKINC